MMDQVFIYGLVDPSAKQLRYVGKSTNPYTRLHDSRPNSGHLAEARSGRRGYKNNWIRKLLRIGLIPQVIVLESCPESEWRARERMWIRKLKHRGLPLKNVSPGGGGWPTFTLEQVQERNKRVSSALKGRVAHNKGKPMSEEQRRKLSLARMGKTHVHGEQCGQAKLTAAKIREIRREKEAGTSQRTLAKRFGVSEATVSLLLARKTWRRVS